MGASVVVARGLGSFSLWAQELWCLGLVTLMHMGSSWTRDWTLSPMMAGGFFTTEPPGKPWKLDLWITNISLHPCREAMLSQLFCALVFKHHFPAQYHFIKICIMEIIAFTFLSILQLQINNSCRIFGDPFVNYVMWVQIFTIIQISLLLLLVGCKKNRKDSERNYKNTYSTKDDIKYSTNRSRRY